MKKTLLFTCIITSIIFIPYCSTKPEIFHGIVTFKAGTLKVNNQDAFVGSGVKSGDIVVTESNSLAVIQIAQTAVITLRSDTELKFDNLLNKKDVSQVVSLSLNQGSTFHKVIREGTDYSVKTATIVASVRGTSFEVSTDGAKSKISLLNGKVKASGTSVANKEVDLNAGQSLEAGSEGIAQPVVMDKTGIDKLKELDTITAVPDVEKLIPPKDNSAEIKNQSTETQKNEVITETVKESLLKNDKSEDKIPVPGTTELKKDEFRPNANAVKTLMKKQDRTIEDIKVVFQRIDEISLFSGRVIKGAVIERGEMYSIITTGGIVKVSEKEIQTVKVLK